MLSELPFYKELNVRKIDHAFKEYAMSYKVELVEKRDPLIQLETSKTSIKDFFNDLLDETKSTKALKLNFLQFISIRQQKQG